MSKLYRVIGNEPRHSFNIGSIVKATGYTYEEKEGSAWRWPEYAGSIEVVANDDDSSWPLEQYVSPESLEAVTIEYVPVTEQAEVPVGKSYGVSDERMAAIRELECGNVVEVDEGYVIVTDVDSKEYGGRIRGVFTDTTPKATWTASATLEFSKRFRKVPRSIFHR